MKSLGKLLKQLPMHTHFDMRNSNSTLVSKGTLDRTSYHTMRKKLQKYNARWKFRIQRHIDETCLFTQKCFFWGFWVQTWEVSHVLGKHFRWHHTWPAHKAKQCVSLLSTSRLWSIPAEDTSTEWKMHLKHQKLEHIEVICSVWKRCKEGDLTKVTLLLHCRM